VFRSDDSGVTWASTGAWTGYTISSISIDPRSPQTMLVGAYRGLYRTDDAGATWTAVTLPTLSPAIPTIRRPSSPPGPAASTRAPTVASRGGGQAQGGSCRRRCTRSCSVSREARSSSPPAPGSSSRGRAGSRRCTVRPRALSG
jgi:hypothetical protein